MVSYQPIVTGDQVLDVLGDAFAAPIEGLTPLKGGQIARVFSFTTGGDAYVIRFAAAGLGGFEKEALIARRIVPAVVPIPAIVLTGRARGLDFAVSRFAAGMPLDQLGAGALAAIVPALIETMDGIHAADISTWPGAGVFDATGAGGSPSWRAHLAAIRNEADDGGLYGGWHALFRESFLERDLFDAVYARMEALLPRWPEERSLVHGDFGFDNVLADGARISPVLDWANARYGDFLYDVAWLDFFPSHEDFGERFRAHYAATGRPVPEYDARLRCYGLYIGLDALRFFAKTGQRGHYHWARGRLLELSDGARGDDR